MADLEKLNAPPVPPQQIEQRRHARLKVAEYYLNDPDARTATGLHLTLDMLGLFPSQDHEHVPTTMSRGRLTNSTMIQTSDARRRAGK